MKAPVPPVVIDTNVPLTANKKDDPSPACVLACVHALQAVMTTGHLVLDEHWHIINEYKHKLSPDGQPGIGDRFLKWVLTNHANLQRCSKVRLTPRQEDPRDFEEFPRDEALAGFDPMDRKFVAVSCARPSVPSSSRPWTASGGACARPSRTAECGSTSIARRTSKKSISAREGSDGGRLLQVPAHPAPRLALLRARASRQGALSR